MAQLDLPLPTAYFIRIPNVGDTIDVMIDRTGMQPEGYVLLSYSRAARLRIWDTLEQAARDQLLTWRQEVD